MRQAAAMVWPFSDMMIGPVALAGTAMVSTHTPSRRLVAKS
jgi:hypothetical protein